MPFISYQLIELKLPASSASLPTMCNTKRFSLRLWISLSMCRQRDVPFSNTLPFRTPKLLSLPHTILIHPLCREHPSIFFLSFFFNVKQFQFHTLSIPVFQFPSSLTHIEKETRQNNKADNSQNKKPGLYLYSPFNTSIHEN